MCGAGRAPAGMQLRAAQGRLEEDDGVVDGVAEDPTHHQFRAEDVVGRGAAAEPRPLG